MFPQFTYDLAKETVAERRREADRFRIARAASRRPPQAVRAAIELRLSACRDEHEREQPVVEERDLLPVGFRLEVEGRDRSLELVLPRAPQRQRALECRAALLDLRRVPAAPVLVGEQHELALGRDARVAARVLQE